jgi:hypothetical protein
VDPARPALVPWAALKAQFGWHYAAMFKFRQVFRQALAGALTQYGGAQVGLDGRGLRLRASPPPVRRRLASSRGACHPS